MGQVRSRRYSENTRVYIEQFQKLLLEVESVQESTNVDLTNSLTDVILILGKTNSGKTSLVRLLRNEKLKVRILGLPETFGCHIENVDRWKFIDTHGLLDITLDKEGMRQIYTDMFDFFKVQKLSIIGLIFCCDSDNYDVSLLEWTQDIKSCFDLNSKNSAFCLTKIDRNFDENGDLDDNYYDWTSVAVNRKQFYFGDNDMQIICCGKRNKDVLKNFCDSVYVWCDPVTVKTKKYTISELIDIRSNIRLQINIIEDLIEHSIHDISNSQRALELLGNYKLYDSLQDFIKYFKNLGMILEFEDRLEINRSKREELSIIGNKYIFILDQLNYLLSDYDQKHSMVTDDVDESIILQNEIVVSNLQLDEADYKIN